MSAQATSAGWTGTVRVLSRGFLPLVIGRELVLLALGGPHRGGAPVRYYSAAGLPNALAIRGFLTAQAYRTDT